MNNMFDEIKYAWENTPETASQIGHRFGMTKGKIIGMAHRAQWESYNPGFHRTYRTMEERLAAIHLAFDQVVAEGKQILDNGGRFPSRHSL